MATNVFLRLLMTLTLTFGILTQQKNNFPIGHVSDLKMASVGWGKVLSNYLLQLDS
jgi:hypothetical protein